MSLAFKAVSVVVQGPVTEWTLDVTTSVRRHMPGAELVLSTYPADDLDRFGADVVVENIDPGSAVVATRGPLTRHLNVNRMITTTGSGLRAATRPVTLKLRTDSPLTSARAIRWLSEVPREPPRRHFRERIFTTLGAGVRQTNFLYSLPDLVQLGCRTDLVDLWSLDLVDEVSLVSYFSERGTGPADPGSWNTRYAAEQVVWMDFLRRRGVDVEYEHNGAPCRPGELERSLRLLVDNVVMLDLWQMGVSLPKHGTLTGRRSLDDRMGFAEWLRLDRRFNPELYERAGDGDRSGGAAG